MKLIFIKVAKLLKYNLVKMSMKSFQASSSSLSQKNSNETEGQFPLGSKLFLLSEFVLEKEIDRDYVAMPHQTDIYNKMKVYLNFDDSKKITVDKMMSRMKNYIKPNHTEYWNFNALKIFYNDNEVYFDKVIRKIAKLALDVIKLPKIPFLRALTGSLSEHTITLSQEQISILLANAFFCTFPFRHSDHNKSGAKNSLLYNFPTIHFSSLFDNDANIENQLQKIKCIFHYFDKVTSHDFFQKRGNVTFSRRRINTSKCNWRNSSKPLSRVEVDDTSTIENMKDALQVDFANKKVGGGVLGRGCLQEEIRFLVTTELIVSRLFTEQLKDDEVLIVVGCEQFSNYEGFASKFRWVSDHNDRTQMDDKRRKMTQVVMMDALKMTYPEDQFRLVDIERELNKAYCAFKDYRTPPVSADLPMVATGNWGCGDFGGDKQFKFLIQLLSASEAGRPLIYMTYNDKSLFNIITTAYSILEKHCFTTGDVYLLLTNYGKCNLYPKTKILDYIIEMFGDKKLNFDTPV